MSSESPSKRLAEELRHVCSHRKPAKSRSASDSGTAQQAIHDNHFPASKSARYRRRARDGQRLGLPVDHELLERISQETGLRTSLMESINKRRGWYLEAVDHGPDCGRSSPVRSVPDWIRDMMKTNAVPLIDEMDIKYELRESESPSRRLDGRDGREQIGLPLE